jgi:hypothetical protein
MATAFQLCIRICHYEGSGKPGTETKRGTHLLVFADDLNLLRCNIDIIKGNTYSLIDASEEAGLEVNAEKTKYEYM